jgi:DNA-directed RNA polymerase specialized sigma24 family protein
MPNINDKTSMGGLNERFSTTCWTKIIDIKKSGKQKEQLIINELLTLYWKPVYCYLRQKGNNNETAKDLTQGFFQEVVLGRNLIQQADKAKGKFRTFLLTALDRYTRDIHQKEKAGKRIPTDKIFALEEFDTPDIPANIQEFTPEQGFNYAWVTDLLDGVFSEVEKECCFTQKEIHWKVFYSRVVDPIINNKKPSSLSEICSNLEIDNESSASNMIITVKRRLRKALERQLVKLSKSGKEIEEEINELLKIFSIDSAG